MRLAKMLRLSIELYMKCRIYERVGHYHRVLDESSDTHSLTRLDEDFLFLSALDESLPRQNEIRLISSLPYKMMYGIVYVCKFV